MGKRLLESCVALRLHAGLCIWDAHHVNSTAETLAPWREYNTVGRRPQSVIDKICLQSPTLARAKLGLQAR